ncbi:MAG: cell division protein FtsZ [Roseomonas sp.]|nr:cell division protein FtsZ [Roseomonas sp.]
MTLNLTIPAHQHTDFTPRITVVGVGGGGTNAVNNMVSMGLEGVEFLVANTDAQSLVHSKAGRRVQLGPHLTQGLGAGAKAEIGRAAAEEATEDLARHLEGSHMVFVTAGMGGGTGTGAAPVIARMARERGILTVGVVTKPFDFEGPKRRKSAEAGIEELQQFVDTLIVIPNQNLFRLANERTTFAEAFKMADNVLYMGVRSVTDLMLAPGLVNLDFADIRTVMAEMGKAMMGTGEAEGEDRAVKAAEAAISNPLLEDTSMRGARGVLINITGGLDMTLFEVDEAANRIRREVDEDASIIFGSSADESMNGRIRVSVVATGIDARQQELPVKLVAIGGGAPVSAVATTQIPQAAPVRAPGGFTPRVAAGQAVAPAPAPMPTPTATRPAQAYAVPVEVEHAPEPVVVAQPEPALRAPAAARPAAPAPAPATSRFGSIFQRATGLIRRDPVAEPVAPQPAAPVAAQTYRAEPAPQPTPRLQNRAAPQEEMGLDIPTFLRRQSN